MKRLLLVRHGETEWNARRCLQGQTDIALSEKGRAQARALAPLVAGLMPDLAVTSDLQRAVGTAALLGQDSARRDGDLREQSLGAWEGRDIADLLAEAPEAYRGWRAGQVVPPGGEAWGDFRARVARGMLRAADGAEASALVICHGGVIRAALDALLGLAPSKIIPVGPGSLTVLALDGQDWRLEAFNVTGARPELDAPD